jgi:chemotaxis protein MotB
MRARRLGILAAALVAVGGCALTLAKRSPWDVQQLAQLGDELERFKALAQLKEDEAQELRRAKAMLEERLSSSDVSIGYDERGLVTRVLDRVLFDSGRAKLRRTSYSVLDRVSKVLQDVPGQPVLVEGHTDDQPIRHSGWADNQVLSEARAQAVADYLVQRGLEGARLRVQGMGERKPIAANDTPSGRQENRRVEIVVLPQASELGVSQGPRRRGRATK